MTSSRSPQTSPQGKSPEPDLPTVKLMVVGGVKVGKTALINRFITGRWEEETGNDEEGVDLATKIIEVMYMTAKGVQKKEKVRLKIWHAHEGKESKEKHPTGSHPHPQSHVDTKVTRFDELDGSDDDDRDEEDLEADYEGTKERDEFLEGGGGGLGGGSGGEENGASRFRDVTASYFKEMQGVIIVYDPRDETSVHKVGAWLADIESHTASDHNIEVAIVASKADICSNADLHQHMIANYGFPSMEVSAKTGQNVNEVFVKIASTIRSVQHNSPWLDQLFQHDQKPHDVTGTKKPAKTLNHYFNKFRRSRRRAKQKWLQKTNQAEVTVDSEYTGRKNRYLDAVKRYKRMKAHLKNLLQALADFVKLGNELGNDFSQLLGNITSLNYQSHNILERENNHNRETDEQYENGGSGGGESIDSETNSPQQAQGPGPPGASSPIPPSQSQSHSHTHHDPHHHPDVSLLASYIRTMQEAQRTVENFGKDLLERLERSQPPIISDVKRRMAQRERARLDYDAYRRKVRELMAKTTVEQEKLHEKKAKLLRTQETFNTINEHLIRDFDAVTSQRRPFVITSFRMFLKLLMKFMWPLSKSFETTAKSLAMARRRSAADLTVPNIAGAEAGETDQFGSDARERLSPQKDAEPMCKAPSCKDKEWANGYCLPHAGLLEMHLEGHSAPTSDLSPSTAVTTHGLDNALFNQEKLIQLQEYKLRSELWSLSIPFFQLHNLAKPPLACLVPPPPRGRMKSPSPPPISSPSPPTTDLFRPPLVMEEDVIATQASSQSSLSTQSASTKAASPPRRPSRPPYATPTFPTDLLGGRDVPSTNSRELTPMANSRDQVLPCIAIRDYNAEQSGDLSFREGDRIMVYEWSNDEAGGWWKGSLNGFMGYLPASYVEPIPISSELASIEDSPILPILPPQPIFPPSTIPLMPLPFTSTPVSSSILPSSTSFSHPFSPFLPPPNSFTTTTPISLPSSSSSSTTSGRVSTFRRSTSDYSLDKPSATVRSLKNNTKEISRTDEPLFKSISSSTAAISTPIPLGPKPSLPPRPRPFPNKNQTPTTSASMSSSSTSSSQSSVTSPYFVRSPSSPGTSAKNSRSQKISNLLGKPKSVKFATSFLSKNSNSSNTISNIENHMNPPTIPSTVVTVPPSSIQDSTTSPFSRFTTSNTKNNNNNRSRAVSSPVPPKSHLVTGGGVGVLGLGGGGSLVSAPMAPTSISTLSGGSTSSTTTSTVSSKPKSTATSTTLGIPNSTSFTKVLGRSGSSLQTALTKSSK